MVKNRIQKGKKSAGKNSTNEEQKLLEVPAVLPKPELLPKLVASDSITAVYTKLRDRDYSPEVATNAMQYARKGPSDWNIPSVDACEASINAGIIVPKGPEDGTFGEMTVVREPVCPPVTSMTPIKSTPLAPPAQDYGLRGGPLLYEDFAELWAEEEAEEAAKAKVKAEAEKATLDEEYQNHQEIVQKEQTQPVSLEYNRHPDVGPTKVHCSTDLLKYSVDYLDIQHYDLSDEERKRGKIAALPRLEMLKILAPMGGRSLDDPGIVDDYIQVLREQYEKIRVSKKLVDTVGAKPAGMKNSGDTAQGLYGGALRRGVVVGAVTGVIGGAISAAVLAGAGGLYHKFFA
ncbi:hypothetical protein BZA77DRAFT_291291 [Pyronema omphalodes]|nr:hypothetical protein BZA77DRAFT_291291 [Pyronema omphalodes]